MQSTFALLENLSVGNLVSNEAALNTYFAEQFARYGLSCGAADG